MEWPLDIIKSEPSPESSISSPSPGHQNLLNSLSFQPDVSEKWTAEKKNRIREEFRAGFLVKQSYGSDDFYSKLVRVNTNERVAIICNHCSSIFAAVYGGQFK
uniref:Uncharacterized protein n=1 Tax=Acrobeloides nanus TaxID=290746 RepID=A0A914EP23_9BILA